jgi:hypothetical protein
MRKFLSVSLSVLAVSFISAQTQPARAQISYAQTVASCGTPNNTPVVGNPYPVTMDLTGRLCNSGGSTSLTGSLPAGTNTIGAVNPARATTTPTSGAVTTANTFQSVLAANANRLGCNIFPTASGGTILVSVGTGNAAYAESVSFPNVFNCGSPQGMVITDQISVTSATASTAYAVWAQ